MSTSTRVIDLGRAEVYAVERAKASEKPQVIWRDSAGFLVMNEGAMQRDDAEWVATVTVTTHRAA
jgi:hypothetical protein